jgi:hypothetical protein
MRMSELPEISETIELARESCRSAAEVRSRSAVLRTTSEATRRASRTLRHAPDASGPGAPPATSGRRRSLKRA